MSVSLYAVEDRGFMVFSLADPRLSDPALVVNEFVEPADYPEGRNQILGRRIDDPTVFQSFPDDATCTRSGFEVVPFTIVPDWDHYCRLIRRPR